MKTLRRFTRNRFFSHLRIATAGTLIMAAAIAFLATTNTALVGAGSAKTYIVLYKTQSVSADAANAIAGAGGTMVATYDAIGVVIARSDNDAFRSNLMKNSAVQGVAVQGKVAANDDNGHGTHTAGTIAAAKNTIGIVGVAPNVKIAGIKAGNSAGFFFPEAVVCAFMWAGSHHMNVTNNSYFADPWYFNCKNDPVQRAIWEAERRAIRFAMKNGTVVVAAEGNFSDDLAHPTMDLQSPDNTTPVPREVTNACAVVPVEVPGVIGVTANGNLQLKSYYSSYGVGSANVIAPGGDRRLQITAAAPNGRVLSTFPAALNPGGALAVFDCSVSPCASYLYLQGTSLASPHASGVAALIAIEGITSPGAIAAKLQNTADPIDCPPDLSIYAPFPSVNNGAPQVCHGTLDYNSFNGHGQINALSAVTQ